LRIRTRVAVAGMAAIALTVGACSSDPGLQDPPAPTTAPTLPDPVADLDTLAATAASEPCAPELADSVKQIVNNSQYQKNVALSDVSVTATAGIGPTGLNQCRFDIDIAGGGDQPWSADSLTITMLPKSANTVSDPIAPPPAGLAIGWMDDGLGGRDILESAGSSIKDTFQPSGGRVGPDRISAATEAAMAATGLAFNAPDAKNVASGDLGNPKHTKGSSAKTPTWYAAYKITDEETAAGKPIPATGYLVETAWTTPATTKAEHSLHAGMANDVVDWFNGTLDAK
jgi:hypothetical protein